MPTVKWSPTAKADLEELAFYIGVERRSPKGAASLVDSREACAALFAAISFALRLFARAPMAAAD